MAREPKVVRASGSETLASVRVPSMLRPAVGGERVVAAHGATLRELIANVDSRHPGFAGQLVEADGTQRRFVNIYLNDEDVRYLQGLDTPVREGDVISILPAVAGGA
jgi:molybdopterin converting factor small subunit